MKNLLRLSALFLGLWFYGLSFAAIDHFDIQATPTKVKVGESVDITLKAMDKDWNVVKDYVWEVLIFSQSDPKAEFPWVLTENTYKFKTWDAWVVKFENAVKFTKAWTQDINVYDISNEDIFGYAEVEVTNDAPATQSWDISIKYPENGITLWTDKVKVSWTTLKNHKLKIVLNNEKETDSISNGEWLFEVELTSIPSWENTLKAKLFDADGKSIWESSEVFFKIEANTPKFKSIKLAPEALEYSPEYVVNVTVEATSWLTSLDVIINDVVSKLTEGKSGSYTWTITTPKNDWEYKIDVVMKNELGLEAKEMWVTALKVKAPELNAAATWTVATWVVEEPKVEINCDDFKKELEVKNIKSVKLKSKSVISWDKVEKASSYNVYKKDRNGTGMTLIENVQENKYEIVIEWDVVEFDDFAVKAVFKDDVCNIEWNASDMTKVQTGPKEMLFMIILISLTIWIFMLRRRNA